MSSITASLLLRLQAKDRDEEAWQRLLDLYGPLVYSHCRRGRVPAKDVGDVGQEVFLEVLKGLPHFRRDRPGDTFRGWLLRITRCRVADYWRARGRSPEGEAPGGSDARDRLTAVPQPEGRGAGPAPDGPPGEAGAGELEGLRRRALELIAPRFAPRTWKACWLVVLEGRPVDEVAETLGVTPNAVRVAKSRVLACLRDEFGDLLD
jgi:RNA polymerase sigma-70 factor (ECF subfamily)